MLEFMILVFIAFIALFNEILTFLGNLTGINDFISENTIYNELSLEMIFGYIFAPVVLLNGSSF